MCLFSNQSQQSIKEFRMAVLYGAPIVLDLSALESSVLQNKVSCASAHVRSIE
jgi:hypothetical protein